MAWPGARSSKAPKTLRALEAIFNCLYIENKEVYSHETCMKGNFVRIKNMSKEQPCKLKA